MPAHAQKRYRHIYIYTHRESLVRNHEPRAKALGNNVCIYISCYAICTCTCCVMCVHVAETELEMQSSFINEEQDSSVKEQSG